MLLYLSKVAADSPGCCTVVRTPRLEVTIPHSSCVECDTRWSCTAVVTAYLG